MISQLSSITNLQTSVGQRAASETQRIEPGKGSSGLDMGEEATVSQSPGFSGERPNAIRAVEGLEEAEYAAMKARFAMKLEESAGPRIRGRITEVDSQTPVPARELSGAEAEAAHRQFTNAEPFLITDTGRKSFRDGDQQYNFFSDGRITVHEAGVPTSQQEKDDWLSGLRGTLGEIEKHTGGLSLEELRANYEAATLEVTRIVEEATRSGTSGQFYDTVA